jgi:hypothetical protein
MTGTPDAGRGAPLDELPPETPHTLPGEGSGSACLVSSADGVPETERVPALP